MRELSPWGSCPRAVRWHCCCPLKRQKHVEGLQHAYNSQHKHLHHPWCVCPRQSDDTITVSQGVRSGSRLIPYWQHRSNGQHELLQQPCCMSVAVRQDPHLSLKRREWQRVDALLTACWWWPTSIVSIRASVPGSWMAPSLPRNSSSSSMRMPHSNVCGTACLQWPAQAPWPLFFYFTQLFCFCSINFVYIVSTSPWAHLCVMGMLRFTFLT